METVAEEWARLQAEQMYPLADEEYYAYGFEPPRDDRVFWTADQPSADQFNNLDAVAQNSAAALGLDLRRRSTWSYDDRIAYIRHFQATILENQVYFSPEVIAVAGNIRTEYQPLDFEIGFERWVAEKVLDNSIVQTLGGVGNAVLSAVSGASQGLSNVGNVGGLVVPVFAIAAVYLFAASASREARRAFHF